MTTNEGTKQLTLEGIAKGLGHSWYYPTQVSNIFGFSLFKEKTESPMNQTRTMHSWYTADQ